MATMMSSRPRIRDAVVHGAFQPVMVTGVHRGGEDSAPGRLDEPGGFLQILGRRRRIGHTRRQLAGYVDRDDVGAFCGQPDGVCASLTPRRAR